MSRLPLHLFALLMAVCAMADGFKLVDGDVQAVIVGNDVIPARVENGYYQGARQVLQHYIALSTGHNLKTVKEADYDAATMPYAIFLGDTSQAKAKYGEILRHLDRDAYVVAVEPQAVYLIGARPHSSDYAQFDFLYSYLRIASYLPAKWGTIVPKHARVVIEPEQRIEIPAFNSRAFSALNTWHRKEKGRLNYSGTGDIPWRLYRRDAFSHNIHSFITVDEFGKTHPEYFPEINGKRVIVSKATAPGPCISNPEVVQIIIQKVRAFFDDPKNVDRDIISLGMTDGGWCECANCQALDGPDVLGNAQSKSRRYYSLLNQVAEAIQQSHPGKSIGVLAYAGADYPPADFPVARNIVPYICQTRGAWGNAEVKRTHLEQTFQWTSRVDKIGVYEYLYGSGYLVPRLYSHQLADYLRDVRSQGNGGFYAEIYSNHGLDGPKAWVTERLVWNPYQDPAELQSIWCQAVFAEAAEPMDAYFTFLETVNTQNIQLTQQAGEPRKTMDSKFYLLQDDKQFMIFTLADLDRAKALLDQARAAATQDSTREHIDYFASCFKVTELMVRGFRSYLPAQQAYESGKPPRELLAALIEGDRTGPDADPYTLLAELEAEDSSTFLTSMTVSLSTSTDLNMRLINGAPWDAVYQQIQAGVTDVAELRAAAREALLQLAPADYATNPVAKPRMAALLAMSDRVAFAHKVETAPVIDGKFDEASWQFTTQSPWFAWKSGLPYEGKTETAFAHDGKSLYVAFRCYQDDLKERARAEGYGAAAWKYVSMEVHLQPDARDASPDEVKRFQVIPAFGGGLWASAHDVTEYAISEGDGYWQAELKIDLATLKMPPERFKALRLNLIRNVREHGHWGKGWFPSSVGHGDAHSRGWLVFE